MQDFLSGLAILCSKQGNADPTRSLADQVELWRRL